MGRVYGVCCTAGAQATLKAFMKLGSHKPRAVENELVAYLGRIGD